jgi:ABC-type uncharacterized transport system substrate-binding protein
LKGRKPQALPVEHVDKFDLTLNYRTAHFLGLSLSPAMLKQANRVIR